MATPSTIPTETAATASLSGWWASWPSCDHAGEGIVEGHVGPADRGRAGSAVGLQDIAVDRHLHLAQGHQVGTPPAGSERSAAGSPGSAPTASPWPPPASARSAVEPGSMEYSAVTHPLPLPRIHGGTRSSTEAVHRTLVRPIETRTEPGAKTVKSRSKLTGRSSSRVRPSVRRVRGSAPPLVAHVWLLCRGWRVTTRRPGRPTPGAPVARRPRRPRRPARRPTP